LNKKSIVTRLKLPTTSGGSRKTGFDCKEFYNLYSLANPAVSCGVSARYFGSRWINIQHRLVYQIIDDENVVKILRLWTHYE